MIKSRYNDTTFFCHDDNFLQDTSRRVTRGGEGGKISSALFQKLEKSVLTLEKMSWLWSSWVLIFHLKNVVLWVSGRKKPQIFHCGAFLSCVIDEMFIKVPWFQENSPALKNSWLRPWRLTVSYEKFFWKGTEWFQNNISKKFSIPKEETHALRYLSLNIVQKDT